MYLKMRQLPQTTKRNSPDRITLGVEDHYWNDKDSFGFIINKSTGTSLIGFPGESHSDILDFGYKDALERAGLLNTQLEDIKFCDWLDYKDEKSLENFNRWYDNNKDKADNYLCGRAWVINDSVSDDTSNYIVVIAWWNELSNDEFKRLNDKIVEDISIELEIDVNNYIAVDNNGNLVELSLSDDECPYIEPCRSLDDLYKMSAIHLASQKEKRERLSDFRVIRDELFQKVWESDPMNKSKTEAEWRSRRYQGD